MRPEVIRTLLAALGAVAATLGAAFIFRLKAPPADVRDGTPDLARLSVLPTDATLGPGGSLRFRVFEAYVEVPATWSVVPETGAGTINTKGEYSAPAEIVMRETTVVKATAGGRTVTSTVILIPRKANTFEEASVKQLERLYDYTKFHIGLYTTLATLMIAAMSEKVGVIGTCTRWFMSIPIAAIVVAGVAAGTIARQVFEYRDFAEFSREPLSLWRLRLRYDCWSLIEHKAFWIAVISALLIILTKPLASPLLRPYLGFLPGC